MAAGQVKKRPAKFYDSVLNTKIRGLLQDADSDNFATSLGVTTEAVRQWVAGYSRPDIDKLGQISSYFNCSVDWLLGLAKDPTTNPSTQAVCEYTGLSSTAADLFHVLISAGEDSDERPVDFIDSMIVDRLFSSLLDAVINAVDCMVIARCQKYQELSHSTVIHILAGYYEMTPEVKNYLKKIPSGSVPITPKEACEFYTDKAVRLFREFLDTYTKNASEVIVYLQDQNPGGDANADT